MENSAPTFISGGRVKTDFYGSFDWANDMVLLPDGKMVVAGVTSNPAMGTVGDFALARYNPDGTLDTSFGTNGTVSATLGTDFDSARALLVQADGKYVLVGSTGDPEWGDNDFALIRYNPDGTLDETFGDHGVVVNDRLLGNSAADATLQVDGKIIAAGYADNFSTFADFALQRFNPDGSLDSSFGDGGIVITAVGPSVDGAYAMELQADGKIILGGPSYEDGMTNFALVRYLSSGALDETFGIRGKVLTDLGGYDQVRDILLQEDGKLLVAGATNNFSFSLVRYNEDGSIDTTFGSGGKVVASFWDSGALPESVEVQADGKILVGGTVHSNLGPVVGVVRYNVDGTLDQGFGKDGIVFLEANLPYHLTENNSLSSLAVSPDGKITAVGSDGYDFYIYRLESDGSLDRGFGGIDTLANYTNVSENGFAPIQSAAEIYDAELAALDNYAGASLTLSRVGGPHPDDSFDHPWGEVEYRGGDVFVKGFHIALAEFAPGSAHFVFNGNATQALVNTMLSGLSYKNSSRMPPEEVAIEWRFEDGAGGVATAQSIIDIIPYNEDPWRTQNPAVLPSGQEDEVYFIHAADLLVGFTDGDSPVLYVADLQANHGSLFMLDEETVVFVPELNYSGTVNLSYHVIDEIDGYAQATHSFSLAAVNDAPELLHQIENAEAVLGQAFSFSLSPSQFFDPDPGARLNYRALLSDGRPLPEWLGFNSTSLSFSGKPSGADAGTWSVRVVASDIFGQSAYDNFEILVKKLRLEGDGGVDTLQGSSEGDLMFGLGGNDMLNGLDGNDEIDGGSGFDTMVGGKGDDVYYVDEVGDMVSETAKQGVDIVRSSASFTLSANVENLELLEAGSIDGHGNKDKNIITGNSGDNLLDGGANADVLRGGLGDDTYWVDNKKDAVGEEADQGEDSVVSMVSFALAANVENLILGGKAANGSGNALDNTIVGNAGKNRLDGAEGDDLLQGGGGTDTLVGGGGDDRLDGGAGKDKLTGGSGSDLFVFSDLGGADTITDFQVDFDHIVLDLAVFSAAGVAGSLDAGAFASGAKLNKAADADDRILHDSSSGKLYYDADGSGGAYSAIQFATVSKGLALGSDDFQLA